MRNNKLTLLKTIIYTELLGFSLLGIAVSCYYFITDYSSFFSSNDNAFVFWIGFAIIASLIILSLFSVALIILIGISILLIKRGAK